ncbi:peptidoglycan-binding domain-containing protein [Roseofilum casamattae]|uniref:Peptidoglycan-binding protein n=1 Tax=Roseofilum casamattae BLCC-M143 TaxID=3022442 RepID=A0ABT7BV82_9CYAN|nr:peptidoglycan-binding protein [Roseofilum casamattae]MDJ1183005.1 peptidoglycan-binding protein [Roseofilum casamattae BLCC-M143]
MNKCPSLASMVRATLTFVAIVGCAILPARSLEIGENGPEVRELQEKLRALGYFNLPPTGLFREVTRDAVIRFQSDRGLVPDGIVGAETWRRLREGSARNSTPVNKGFLERGDRGPQVRTLQEKLTAAGVYDGPITGVYGTLTEAAVRRYQEAQGLTVDGLYGGRTRSRLEATETVADVPSDPYILELQQILQKRGWYDGPLDGIMGPKTREAIAKAQERYGISAEDLR